AFGLHICISQVSYDRLRLWPAINAYRTLVFFGRKKGYAELGADAFFRLVGHSMNDEQPREKIVEYSNYHNGGIVLWIGGEIVDNAIHFQHITIGKRLVQLKHIEIFAKANVLMH